MIFRDLQQHHELEDKDCFFWKEMKIFRAHYFVKYLPWNSRVFLAPSWETCLPSSLMFPHLWLKLLLCKTAFSSPTQIKCFKPQDTNSVITVPTYMYQNSLLLEVQEKAKETLSQHSACTAAKPTLEYATKAGPDAAAGATREHTARQKLSLCKGPDSKSTYCHCL